MTTTKATVLSTISQLTIEERPCDLESVPADCETESQLTAKVKQNDRTIRGNLAWRTSSVVKDMEMMDKESSTRAGDIERERLSCSGECGDNEYCTHFEEEPEVSSKTPDINITHNIGTVIVDLTELIEEHRDLPVLTKDFNSTQKNWPSSSLSTNRRISPAKSRAILRKPAISSSRNNRRELVGKNKPKGRQRQTLLNFRHQKRRDNIKSVSGKKNDININVVNNSGQVIVGRNVTFNTRNSELGGRGSADLRTWKRECHNQSSCGLEIVECDGVVSAPSIPRQSVIYMDNSIIISLEKFYRITSEIYPLRDNGRWQDFYRKVDAGLRYARQHGLQEEEVFLTVEKSIALGYQKKNDESKKMVKQAKDMILSRPLLKMREFLVVLSHCQLAALYRRESKLDKAKNAVSIAEQNIVLLPSHLARSYVTYEKASNWFVQYSYFPLEGEQERSSLEAKKEFKNCISACEQTLSETDSSVYLRRHHFCLVKLALMNLNCNTRAARGEPVIEENIFEAAECINRMVERYTGQMGESTNMLLQSAQSGLSYRQGDYARAEQFACEALDKAESLGFELEVHQLRERLNEIRLLNQASAKI